MQKYSKFEKIFFAESFHVSHVLISNNDITLSEIKKLIKSLGLSDNSIRGICGRIASVYNYAIDRGIVDAIDGLPV